MKLAYFLVLLGCGLFACKSNQYMNKPKNESVAEVLFSTDDFFNATSDTLDFSTTFILNRDEFLTIYFALKDPLVASLLQLDTNLSEKEVLEKGNFQFSFLVDGELVYTENLSAGAGLKVDKTTGLNHTIRLVAPQKMDYWGWFMWLKFMKLGGGQDALGDGTHLLTIAIRPYLNTGELKVGKLLAKGSVTVEVAKIKVDEKLIPVQPIQEGSGWELSDAVYDKEKIEALNRKIAEQRFENINGLVVIKNGELLIEEYFNGETRESLHDPRSVGKSIASSVLGIAIDENFIANEGVFLCDFYELKAYENYSANKDSVTLKSLLTMCSGFAGDDADFSSVGNEEKMYPTADWVKFALDLPMDSKIKIGESFAYFTAGVVVLGDVIHKTVPNGLVAYADEKLFAPLGVTNYEWEYTPQHVGNTAGGIRLRALDFAKYGQLYKNNGEWNGKRILSEDWVKKSLDRQVDVGNGVGYGYLFWNKVFEYDGNEYEVSYCAGNGGNTIFIFKDLPFVVVITASAYNMPNAHTNVDKMMLDYILPALLGD